MTRLTPDLICDVPVSVSGLDSRLEGMIGCDLRKLACSASNVNEKDMIFENYSVAVVPITSGKGTIAGFTESVAAAVKGIGMRPFITHSSDVTGVAEAFLSDADIIFMADDDNFIALNTRSRMFSDNISSTARGFVSALSAAEGRLDGKNVLLLGAGRVGDQAVKLLLDAGSKVEVADIVYDKAKDMELRYKGVKARRNIEDAIRDNRIIFNASPGAISGDLIQHGAVISSPGVPYAFDEIGESRSKVIIHDVLSIGVAVMAVSSASTSLYMVPEAECEGMMAVIP